MGPVGTAVCQEEACTHKRRNARTHARTKATDSFNPRKEQVRGGWWGSFLEDELSGTASGRFVITAQVGGGETRDPLPGRRGRLLAEKPFLDETAPASRMPPSLSSRASNPSGPPARVCVRRAGRTPGLGRAAPGVSGDAAWRGVAGAPSQAGSALAPSHCVWLPVAPPHCAAPGLSPGR